MKKDSSEIFLISLLLVFYLTTVYSIYRYPYYQNEWKDYPLPTNYEWLTLNLGWILWSLWFLYIFKTWDKNEMQRNKYTIRKKA
jgi:hypothetical protein